MQNAEIRTPVILVTGTSSGIGLEIIRKLRLLDTYRVVATARETSLHKLTELGFSESDRFKIRAMDVTSARDRQRVTEEIYSSWGGVDVLINNAGISYRAVVEHMCDDEELEQMATNYLGAMALIRLALPGMRERHRGHIINISSVGGMMAMPTMSAYSASKFALEGASEALWYELRPWNIHVTLVQPGFIRSDSFRHVYYSKMSAAGRENPHDPYHPYYAAMAPFVEKLMNRSLSDAESVAGQVVNVMRKRTPPLRCPATLDAHLFYWLRRLLPRRIYHRILYYALPGIRNWGEPGNISQRRPGAQADQRSSTAPSALPVTKKE